MTVWRRLTFQVMGVPLIVVAILRVIHLLTDILQKFTLSVHGMAYATRPLRDSHHHTDNNVRLASHTGAFRTKHVAGDIVVAARTPAAAAPVPVVAAVVAAAVIM